MANYLFGRRRRAELPVLSPNEHVLAVTQPRACAAQRRRIETRARILQLCACRGIIATYRILRCTDQVKLLLFASAFQYC